MRPDEDNHHRPTGRPTAAPTGRLTAADLMTGREVAALLHAPVSTVEDWARRNILPSVKIGRRRLYIRQSIEAVLTSRAPTR
jgi:excisionase family DNA binding protein